MPRARRILFASLMVAFASRMPTAFPQEAAGNRAPANRPGPNAKAAEPQAAPDPARMKQLLALWEKQSAKLKTLDVSIYRIDRNVKWGDETHYEGRAIFKNPQLAYLDFKKIKTAKNAEGRLVPVPDLKDPKKRSTTPEETIICGANEVWQYSYPVKQIFVYPLAKEQRQRALDEGPLPFLFNMKAEQAEARYEMTLLGEKGKYYSILVKPKLKGDKEAFRMAQIVLDKEYLLPVRIALISPDNKSSKDFRVEQSVPNAVVDNRWFQGRALEKWKLIRNPDAQGQPRDVGAAPGRPVQGLMPRR